MIPKAFLNFTLEIALPNAQRPVLHEFLTRTFITGGTIFAGKSAASLFNYRPPKTDLEGFSIVKTDGTLVEAPVVTEVCNPNLEVCTGRTNLDIATSNRIAANGKTSVNGKNDFDINARSEMSDDLPDASVTLNVDDDNIINEFGAVESDGVSFDGSLSN